MSSYKTHLIGAPNRAADQVRYPKGNTGDIIETVMFADKNAADYTKAFAATLKGPTVLDTCRNIWRFVKTQIPYVLDKRGFQWVKSPGRLWADKAGDCKSFSVFTASCLQNLGIDYGYRFASYRANDPTATHVYVFVKDNGREIILDSVWDGPFNSQKKFEHKKDIMSEVHYLGDVGRSRKKIKAGTVVKHLLFPSPSPQLFAKLFGKNKKRRQQSGLIPLPFPQGGAVPVPAAMMPAAMPATATSTVNIPLPDQQPTMPVDILIKNAPVIVPPAKPEFTVTGNNDYTQLVLPDNVDQMADGEMDLLLTRQRLAIEKANSARVGGPFNFQIDNYDKAIAVVNKALENLHNPDYISGMGEALERQADAVGKNKAAGTFFKKIGKGLKKGLKAVAKVATAPQRLALKGVMEIYLPKSSYMFLYLFAATPDKLPDVMKKKRAKAEKFKKFIVDGIGMKENHFMGIVRNALTKQLGKSPESYLADALKARVSGIGAAGKKTTVRKSPKNKAHPQNKAQAKSKKSGSKKQTDSSGSGRSKYLNIDTAKLKQYAQNHPEKAHDDRSDDSGNGFDPDSKENPTPVRRGRGILSEENVEAGQSLVKNLGGGNWIGAIITALTWIIKKVIGLFKKKKDKEDLSLTKDDLPDIEKDAANVFEYKDLHEDFSTVPEPQKEQIKQVATELMVNRANERTIDIRLQNELPYLTVRQRAEVKYEIAEGPEAIDENEAADLAREIKDNGRDLANADKNGGGSAGTGLCHC